VSNNAHSKSPTATYRGAAPRYARIVSEVITDIGSNHIIVETIYPTKKVAFHTGCSLYFSGTEGVITSHGY
jgi:hypothetical protein